MNIFIVTFLVMLLAVLAMAVGVLAGRRGIQGSCGGLNNIQGLEDSCSICSQPCEKRKKAIERVKAEKLNSRGI